MNAEELKRYIVDEEKIEFVLNELGCHSIQFQEHTNTYTATQPDGDNPKGVVIKNNYYLNYYSYSRDIHIEDERDLFFLVGEIKKFDNFKDIMLYVHGLFNLEYSFSKKSEPKKDYLAVFHRVLNRIRKTDINDFKLMDDSILTEFMPMIHIDLFRDGIAGNTIKKFGLGYSYKWKRTIFPHRYWATGQLMGYNARTSIESYDELGISKYFITPGMNKAYNLYGLWENKKDIESEGLIVVGEAEKSVCKRDSLKDPTWVAISGKTLSQEQIRIILGLNVREVVIALDNDVDIVSIWDICEKFYRLRKVSYIKDRWNLLGEKDSPADAPNKIYKFMFKYRNVYTEKEHKEYLRRTRK